MFDKTNIHTLGIIENMSQHSCSECGHLDAIFGHGGAIELAKRAQCSLLGQLPLDARIGAGCDKGMPTARIDFNATDSNALAIPFIKAALLTAIEIGKRPLNYADKFPPIVVES